jgi:mono/diheme cytochrome c family protein
LVGGSLGFLLLAVLASFTVTAAAPSAATTQGQAEAGAAVYGDWCAVCHGAAAEGGEGPALDRRTLASYRSADRLFRFLRISMPADEPGTLSDQEYLDVLAYLLDMNAMNPDGAPMDPATLADIPLTT